MQIHDIRKLTDMRHLNLFTIQYQDKTGKDKTWTYASRSGPADVWDTIPDRPDAVVVVPYHVKDRKLVIIREFRVVLGGYQYGFPAGLLDPGETVVQAGKRELFEETGLRLTRVKAQSPPVYSSSGMTDESVSLVYAECEGIPSSAHTEDSEDIQTLLVSRKEAGRLLESPDIRFDVKTWIVLRQFADHGVF
ncbi:MAG: NUDIX hydrolase [Desulfotignum sp.]|nr:NUDIX hydrolase [Desulfotignum sp.]